MSLIGKHVVYKESVNDKPCFFGVKHVFMTTKLSEWFQMRAIDGGRKDNWQSNEKVPTIPNVAHWRVKISFFFLKKKKLKFN